MAHRIQTAATNTVKRCTGWPRCSVSRSCRWNVNNRGGPFCSHAEPRRLDPQANVCCSLSIARSHRFSAAAWFGPRFLYVLVRLRGGSPLPLPGGAPIPPPAGGSAARTGGLGSAASATGPAFRRARPRHDLAAPMPVYGPPQPAALEHPDAIWMPTRGPLQATVNHISRIGALCHLNNGVHPLRIRRDRRRMLVSKCGVELGSSSTEGAGGRRERRGVRPGRCWPATSNPPPTTCPGSKPPASAASCRRLYGLPPGRTAEPGFLYDEPSQQNLGSNATPTPC
jgi:hypothetical protein